MGHTKKKDKIKEYFRIAIKHDENMYDLMESADEADLGYKHVICPKNIYMVEDNRIISEDFNNKEPYIKKGTDLTFDGYYYYYKEKEEIRFISKYEWKELKFLEIQS